MKFVLVLLSLLSLTTFGKTYLVNKDHSAIQFSVGYMGLSDVDGQFLKFDGSAEYDEISDRIESVNLSIDPKSIFSGNKMRDQHLRESDFFSVNEYPNISFDSKKIIAKEDGKLIVTGNLTMRGVTRSVTLKGKKSAITLDTWGYKNFFTVVEGQINRKDFNLKWNKTLEGAGLLVSEVVKIKASFQMQPSDAKTPFSKHKIPDTKEIRLREKFVRGEISKENYDATKYKGPKEKNPPMEKLVVKEEESSIVVQEKDMHKTLYTKFKKDSNWYYFCSMLLSIFASFGYISLRKNLKKMDSKGKRISSEIVLGLLFSAAVYVVSFDDFMAFSISIFK